MPNNTDPYILQSIRMAHGENVTTTVDNEDSIHDEKKNYFLSVINIILLLILIVCINFTSLFISTVIALLMVILNGFMLYRNKSKNYS